MLLKARRYASHGFTLTELLIALALNVVIFTALIAMFASNVVHYEKTIQINRLNQQLQSIMQMMVTDIRRAGYWANANNDVGLGQNNNPFMAGAADLTIGAGNNCITFTYDKNANGALSSVSTSSDDEHYGYRLLNGIIQARPWGAAATCAAGLTAWESITDTKVVTITALTFALTTQSMAVGGGSTISLRSIDITLTGRLTNDATVTKTLTEHVRIRNDKFNP